MGNVYQVEMLRLLFTRGTWKTCRSPTLRRGWRAGSGNCACPPLTHSRVGWLGPPGPQGSQGYRGGAARRGHGRAAREQRLLKGHRHSLERGVLSMSKGWEGSSRSSWRQGKHLHSMSSLLALVSSGPPCTHSPQDTEA